MNIYKQELKMKIRSVLVWSFWITLIIFLFLSIYSSIGGEIEALNRMLDNYPKELLVAFGMDGIDMSTILGFFGFALLFCQLCVSIQAANYGISLVSVEERELTADFLLAKPVSRTKILTSKLLAALTCLAITNVVVWVVATLAINRYKGEASIDSNTLILLLLTITFLQLFFLTVGLLISLIMKKVKNVTPVSMGLVFGLYLLSTLAGLLEVDKFSYLTPFKHFEANAIIKNNAYDMTMVMISVAVILLSVIASYWLYQRKNVLSV